MTKRSSVRSKTNRRSTVRDARALIACIRSANARESTSENANDWSGKAAHNDRESCRYSKPRVHDRDRRRIHERRHGFAIEALFRARVRFFLARDASRAIGCCDAAFDDGFAELKGMYVCDAARGSGVADALLAHVEGGTIAHEIACLRLETGMRQITALRFYERARFVRTTAFGVYTTMSPEATATSIFMEKRLDYPQMRSTRHACACMT